MFKQVFFNYLNA